MLKKIYKFSASIKLAIPLMILLVLAMIAGTIIESVYGTEQAQAYIYYHEWFTVLNSLIAINILLATIIRYPFKKSQTGFVITHSGLLLIFFGAILNQMNGIDGHLVLREGMTSNKVQIIRNEERFLLPFTVTLKEFKLRENAMTTALMDYESVINIAGVDYKVSMNNPMTKDGFYLYQSSYQLDKKAGNISIFSVGFDPGRPLKYFGSLFLCLGMFVMYWFKTGIFAREVKIYKMSKSDYSESEAVA